MFMLMVGLVVLGVVLLVGGRWIARAVVGRDGDPVGLTRILWVLGALLLVAALIVRPHSDETAAFPPPPDVMEERAR